MNRITQIAAMLAAALVLSLAAAPASAKERGELAQISLLPGWRLPNGNHMTAIRVELENGWKTYWRAPGDAGIPPTFEWSSSQPMDSIKLSWPTPEVFDLGGMTTFGYTGVVIIPVEIARNGGFDGPVELSLAADLGICKDICVPASAEGSATLTVNEDPDAEILTSLSRQPRIASQKANCSVAAVSDGLQVVADIQIPELANAKHAVIEHRNAMIWVSETTLRHVGKTLQLEADLVAPGAMPFSVSRSDLTFTVFGDNDAIEISGCAGG